MRKIVFLIFLIRCFLALPLYGKFPEPSGFLNDFAGVLALQEKQDIENLLNNIEKNTGVEVCVVIVHSLDGKNLEEFANELFNTWGIGKKKKDNGVLFLISMEDRKIRIEAGYGLEDVLTDGRCGSIIRNIMVPQFRNGKYYNGISAAVKQIEGIILGNLPDSSEQKLSLTLENIVFLIIWQAFCIFYAFVLARFFGIVIIGGMVTIIDLAMLLSPKSELMFLGMMAPFLSNIIIFFVVMFVGFKNKTRLRKYYGKNWRLLRPWGMRSGGGRLSGGGFGGGSSGGGGASGGW